MIDFLTLITIIGGIFVLYAGWQFLREKKVFCRHKWEVAGTMDVSRFTKKHTYYYSMECHKCGKQKVVRK